MVAGQTRPVQIDLVSFLDFAALCRVFVLDCVAVEGEPPLAALQGVLFAETSLEDREWQLSIDLELHGALAAAQAFDVDPHRLARSALQHVGLTAVGDCLTFGLDPGTWMKPGRAARDS